MSKLAWDETGKRFYEAGADRGVLYKYNSKLSNYGEGVAWSGLTNVSQSPSGAESSPMYADNIKYANLKSNEDFGGTIEAYTYPDEFAECDGSAEIAPGVNIGQQNRTKFGFSYRTKIGNDVDGIEHGYKIHLVYGAEANPSEKSYATINESPEAITLSWEFSTTPVNVSGFKPTSHVEIDSTKTTAEKIKALEDILYGTEEVAARLPLPDEVATLMKTETINEAQAKG